MNLLMPFCFKKFIVYQIIGFPFTFNKAFGVSLVNAPIRVLIPPQSITAVFTNFTDMLQSLPLIPETQLRWIYNLRPA